ncbi:hypothetical protein ACW9HQ_40270, partial [Nocardia gipuzkoensis]
MLDMSKWLLAAGHTGVSDHLLSAALAQAQIEEARRRDAEQLAEAIRRAFHDDGEDRPLSSSRNPAQ